MATGRVPTTANSPLTAKGDLFGYSTTQARVPVGNDGETIVADSSTSTGLRYTSNFAAGKNRIINGDFNINQRAFTSTTTAGYNFDRWQMGFSGGTVTASTQAFTAGTAPVVGYEGTNFARLVSASQSASGDYAAYWQPIEGVRTFANQTVTVSFWAKASTGTPNIGVTMAQSFGSGGSATVVTSPAVQAITTSWVRYSFNVNVPSISGKTIGAGNYLAAWVMTSVGTTVSGSGYAAVGVQNATIDIWGVQVEAGSTATAFQTATGTIQGELAACQRYYYRSKAPSAYSQIGVGPTPPATTSIIYMNITTPVPMRASVQSVDWGGNMGISDGVNVNTGVSSIVPSGGNGGNFGSFATVAITMTSGVLTLYRPYYITDNGAGTTYLGISMEL